MERIIAYIGRKTIDSISHVLDLFAFALRILSSMISRPEHGGSLTSRIIVQQLFFTAVQALPVLVPIALLVGSTVIIQFAKISGQYDFGRVSVLLIVRELGPIITAMLVILRSATAVTIEVSYMQVLNELRALQMAGIDPMRVLCVPRLIGITAALLGLFIVFDLVSIVGGYIIVWLITFIPMGNFLNQIAKAITLTDIIVGIVKALFFGLTITVTCLYRGLEATQWITQVPVATSRAAIECLLYCLVINIFISVAFYI